MTPDQTNQAQATPDQKPLKPVLKWHAEKKTSRDLLCLAAMMCRWDPQQTEGSMEESRVDELAFDKAIAEAKNLYEQFRTAGAALTPQPRAARLLAHPKILAAVIVHKATFAEVDKFTQDVSQEDLTDVQRSVLVREFFVKRCQWPKNGSSEWSWFVQEAPFAFAKVFPQDLLVMCGMDGELVKKVG